MKQIWTEQAGMPLKQGFYTHEFYLFLLLGQSLRAKR